MTTKTKNIQEEEDYRKQIRETLGTENDSKKKGMNGCSVVVILLIILFVICIIAISSGTS